MVGEDLCSIAGEAIQGSQPVGQEGPSPFLLPTRRFVLAIRDGSGAPWLEPEALLEMSCKGSHELHINVKANPSYK